MGQRASRRGNVSRAALRVAQRHLGPEGLAPDLQVLAVSVRWASGTSAVTSSTRTATKAGASVGRRAAASGCWVAAFSGLPCRPKWPLGGGWPPQVPTSLAVAPPAVQNSCHSLLLRVGSVVAAAGLEVGPPVDSAGGLVVGLGAALVMGSEPELVVGSAAAWAAE